MAAPTATARGTPDGIPLRDGYSSKITLGDDATIELWEKSVKPPGIDGGEPVDQTTMHNSTWKTSRPRSLKTITPVTCRASYDPDIYDELTSIINTEDEITVKFADGSTIALWGYLQKFDRSWHGLMLKKIGCPGNINFDLTGQLLYMGWI